MALWTVYEMACFFVSSDANVPVNMPHKFQHSIQMPLTEDRRAGACRASYRRSQMGFGLCGSACGSWSSTIGAPSRTHWLSFTWKQQPLSKNSPRTYLNEAVVAASGPGGGGAAWRGEGGGGGGGGRQRAQRQRTITKTPCTSVLDID